MVGAFFLLTLRPGHEWSMGDDFAQYILHARNIAQGRPYADTGYLYNPDLAVVGPPAYPPVLPLALAPVWLVFGLDLIAMKALMVAFFVGSLGVVSLLVRSALAPIERAALVLVVGLNPYFWDFKDYVLSDIPFLFFASTTLLIGAWALPGSSSSAPRILPAVVLGFASYLAYGTRTAGVALAVTVVAFDLLTARRLRPASLIATGVFGVLATVQQVAIPGVDAYLQQLELNPGGLVPQLLRNAGALGAGFARLWTDGPSSFLARVALLSGAGAATWGYVVRWRHGPSVLEVFLPVYVAVILAWPRGQELRFLIPIVPLLAFYGWIGLRCLPLPAVELRRPAALGLVGVVLLAYAVRYTSSVYDGPIGSGVGAPDTQDLFRFVQHETTPSDVIVFRRPRALALFTDRRSGPFAPGPNRRDVWSYLRDVGAADAISAPQDRRFWSDLAAQTPQCLAAVYQNPTYVVYRLNLDRLCTEALRTLPPTAPPPEEEDDL